MIINMNGTSAGGSGAVLQSKTVTPESLPVVIGPDAGYDGLSQVTINRDSQLKAENIRSGKTIFGVNGTYTGGGSTLELENIGPYQYANDIQHCVVNNYNDIPCTIEVTSAELLPTQGWQYGDQVKFVSEHFDYDNVSYEYGYFATETEYQEYYGKITANITIPETRISAYVDAYADTPAVTEAIQIKYLDRLFLYDVDGGSHGTCLLTKIPSQSLKIFEHKYQNVTTERQEYRTTTPRITFTGLEFLVNTASFNPEEAITSTVGRIGDSTACICKVVK